MIIYRVINHITNKSYIGQTKLSAKRRWQGHVQKSKKSPYHFHKAIRKYGKECWTLEILEKNSDPSIINEREVYWISHFDTFRNGYNSTTGGETPTELSLEARKKISQSQIGNKKHAMPHTEETKAQISRTKKQEL